MRANAFEIKRQFAKIGKPLDRSEWYMTPQTVNAYYDPSMNSLNVPAGILQPPYFDMNWASAVNYGATGATIGHEMTHGFDDEGAQFDGHGNLKNWWASADLAKFREATRCISAQYSRFTVGGGLHVQGDLVTGEAAADLGGLMLAWRALHSLGSRAAAGRRRGIHVRSAVLYRVRALLGGRHSPEASRGTRHHGSAPAGGGPHQRDSRKQPGISAGLCDLDAQSHGQDGSLRHLVRFESSRSFSGSRMRTGASALKPSSDGRRAGVSPGPNAFGRSLAWVCWLRYCFKVCSR